MRLQRWRQVTPRMKWVLSILLLLNLLFAAWALSRGRETISDGASSVTDGYIIAGGIGLTILGVIALAFLPMPAGPVARAQALTLGAQVLHAGGHLLGFYYRFNVEVRGLMLGYDDLLHVFLPMAVGLVFLDFARSRRFLFTTRLGPTRVSILVVIVAIAVAGFWEIFEFVTDQALGTREQDNLPDTMVDMIDGLLGGLLAAAYAYRALTTEQRVKAMAGPRSDELLD
jgi:hypothetical protein